MASDLRKLKREAGDVEKALRGLRRQLGESDRRNGVTSAESAEITRRMARRVEEGRRLIRLALDEHGVTLKIEGVG